MHLLSVDAATTLVDDAAVDLGQRPADLIVATFADTEIACLAGAAERLGDAGPSLCLSPLRLLRHPMSVDLWAGQTVAHAKLVVLRLIGGRAYWPYGLDQVVNVCRSRGIPLAVLPGDDKSDPSLDGWSTVETATRSVLWRCLAEGGVANAGLFLTAAGQLLAGGEPGVVPLALPRAGLYRAGQTFATQAAFGAAGAQPVRAVVLFYRALLLAGDLAPIDRLIEALAERDIPAVGLFTNSLKDPDDAAAAAGLCAGLAPDILLATTGFSTARAEAGWATPFDRLDVPIVQLVLASSGLPAWRESTRGLTPVDLAMQVALPELDGRIHGPVIAFKDAGSLDERTQCRVVRWQPFAEGIARAAAQTAALLLVRSTPRADRRIALILANYPIRDGRLANGVGLDTPASSIVILKTLQEIGYHIQSVPLDGDSLVRQLQAGVTNQVDLHRQRRVEVPLDQYTEWLAELPSAMRAAVVARWGLPEDDPFCVDRCLVLPVLPLGNIVVALQPSRGYEVDPALTWHDPALPPPHRYLAFYLWLRHGFSAHALIQVGKHGNLEWLPGKATGLSAACQPAALIGDLPVVYPFIVNDPGEGTQAKRRTGAVIVDHLTPPLARAGLHGDLQALENLLDEFALARELDRRRAKALATAIAEEAQRLRIDQDLRLAAAATDDVRLLAIDTYLCELKELQIRDGLHVFGQSPVGSARSEMLAALTRLPRGARPEDQSLLRALAEDLGLQPFDPLSIDTAAAAWTGPRPAPLEALSTSPWRTLGDTLERLEGLSLQLIGGELPCPPDWLATSAVLSQIGSELAPALDRSGDNEVRSLLHALDGGFIRPGPSGAPSRGRPDVLPTGRNFFSIDARSLPTPTAWRLGWASASSVVQLYIERHGDWPRSLVVSAWGTANMRTGGDDIAQVLALMGCRPVWDSAGGRVTGVEVLPLASLGRPRVDVTLRISGFFRDAFPQQIALIDEAARLVAGLDEPPETESDGGRRPCRDRPAGRGGAGAGPCCQARVRPRLRQPARRLWCRVAGADRHALVADRCRPR